MNVFNHCEITIRKFRIGIYFVNFFSWCLKHFNKLREISCDSETLFLFYTALLAPLLRMIYLLTVLIVTLEIRKTIFRCRNMKTVQEMAFGPILQSMEKLDGIPQKGIVQKFYHFKKLPNKIINW